MWQCSSPSAVTGGSLTLMQDEQGQAVAAFAPASGYSVLIYSDASLSADTQYSFFSVSSVTGSQHASLYTDISGFENAQPLETSETAGRGGPRPSGQGMPPEGERPPEGEFPADGEPPSGGKFPPDGKRPRILARRGPIVWTAPPAQSKEAPSQSSFEPASPDSSAQQPSGETAAA